MLLNYLKLGKSENCLDLGCGYGVLGLVMAKSASAGHTLMVDKDFVAVDYAEKNRLHNRISNASCLLSNGFDQIPRQQFDVIVSNIPAKVGKEMLYIYLFDALKYLKPEAPSTSLPLPVCGSFSNAGLAKSSEITKRSNRAKPTRLRVPSNNNSSSPGNYILVTRRRPGQATTTVRNKIPLLKCKS